MSQILYLSRDRTVNRIPPSVEPEGMLNLIAL